MDYSNLEDITIPKRHSKEDEQNTIYEDIENFKEYELTQCVAYEMAMRNETVISIKRLIDDDLKQLLDEYIKIRDDENNELNIKFAKMKEEYDEKYYDEDIDNDELNIPNYEEYVLKDNEKFKSIKQNLKLLSQKHWIREFYEDDIIDEAFNRHHPSMSDINKNQYNFIKQEKMLKEHEVIGKFMSVSMSDDGRVIETDDICSAFFNNLMTIFNKSPLERKITNSSKETDLNKIMTKRLKSLIIPKQYDKSIRININLALPINELEAQIKLLKKNFDNDNKMIKTPIELLGKELQQAQPSKNYPKKPNAEKYADMFFIYDYVIARYKDIKQYNALQKEEYEAELLAIQNNGDLNTKQKRDHKKAANSHYKEMKSDATLKDICYEDELTEQLNIQGEMIYKYYRIMKPYIEDMKYKELITGVQAE